MRSRWNMPIYVVYVALCLFVAGLLVKGIGVTAPWQSRKEVVATFRSGDGILANNEVFENGVKVGRVESVEAINGRAQVTMRVEDQRALPLYKDALAQVRKKNLLGETYIELDRGSRERGQMKPRNDRLTIDDGHTISPVDIDQVLAILDPTTRERVKLLINGAGDALAGNGGNLNDQAGTARQLLTELNGPATELSTRKGQLDDIIVELQKFYNVMAAQREEVRAEFATWSDVMGQLANQESAIGGTLQQADALLGSVDTLVNGEVPNLRSIFQQLPGSLAKTQNFLNQANPVLNNLVPIRRSIHDVFPDLNTSFSDTDPNSPLDPVTGQHQHFWSVFSVQCNGDCSGQHETAYQPQAPNAQWAAAMGAG